MSFIRPEAMAWLMRWREVWIASGIAAVGLWVAGFGGWFFLAVGLAVLALGGAVGLLALRRMRFHREIADPGIVEVIEGQLSYMGPEVGGFVGLRDVAELALVHRGGVRFWRVTPGVTQGSGAGDVLLVPVAAQGSDLLFDAFAGLPGLTSQVLVAALEGAEGIDRIVWRRASAGTVYRLAQNGAGDPRR